MNLRTYIDALVGTPVKAEDGSPHPSGKAYTAETALLSLHRTSKVSRATLRNIYNGMDPGNAETIKAIAGATGGKVAFEALIGKSPGTCCTCGKPCMYCSSSKSTAAATK